MTQTPMNAGTVLVVGGTGKTGRRVVQRLREQGRDVRAASRSGGTAFDWHDRSTWGPALDGVRSVWIGLPEVGDREIPVKAFTDAAARAGVRRLVLLSARGLEETGEAGEAMRRAEEAVRSSEAEWSIVRPNNFHQNFDEGAFGEGVGSGELVLPTGGVSEPFVDAEDIAAVAAVLLTEDGHTGRTYELSGPEALTWAQAVAVVGRAAGRTVRFTDADPEGFGDPDGLGSMFTMIRTGTIAEPTDAVRELLGREPVGLASYAARAAAAGAWREL